MPITLPPVSAGQELLQARAARDDGATTQSPLGPSQVIEPSGRIVNANAETNPTTAVIPATTATGGDFGTDAATRSITDTQSTDNSVGIGSDPTNGTDYNNNENNYPSYSTNPGVGDGNDDAASPMNSTQTKLDQLFTQERIVPQVNVLDNYASYTWNATVYMLKKDDANKLFVNKRKVLPGSQVLFRSGGVGPRDNSGIVNTGGTGINGLELDPSNPFTLDCYIDELELNSKITGRGTTSAHNVFSFKMTVTEPMGMSLLDNLYTCAQNLNNAPGVRANYKAQQYLLVLKFYGYDDQGNLVEAGSVDPDGNGGPGVIVEKYYPFLIDNITMRIASKVVQYDWKCTCIPHSIGFGQARGSIPYNIELAGGTLQQLLGTNTNSEVTDPNGATTVYENDGTATTTATSAPTSASTSASQNQTTITSGLMSAMNRYQQKLVKAGIYTIADEYSIEFTDSIIASAQLRKPGDGLDKAQTPMDSSNNANKILPEKQSMLASIRTTAAVAGTQIVQFLDQAIRNSTYITDQALYNYDEETQKLLPKAGTAAKSVAWFKISVEVLSKGHDPKRNDYAYKIKFIVSPYKVDNLESVYFPRPIFTGVHKQYSYWFTGENTQVIDFQQDFNALYYEVISGRLSTQNITSSGREIAKRFYQPTSGQSDQGASGKTNEVSANAADYLYSPKDQAEVKMQIIGDPAWLQQGEAFAGFRPSQFNFNAFLPDGTINYDAQQILFEVDFNLPVDYNIATGLQDPGQNNYNANRTGGIAGRARQSYIYYAFEITSFFKQGKFTQELKGKLRKTLIPKIEEAPLLNTNPYYSDTTDEETQARLEEWAAEDARTADIGATGQDVTSTPFSVPDAGIDPNTDTTVRDQPGISATDASFNLTSQVPDSLLAPAQSPSPPTSDGVVVGLTDGPPSPAAAGATGVTDSNPTVITQNEIVTPRALPVAGTAIVPADTQQYESAYKVAQQNAQAAQTNWQEAVQASNSVNFPGATGSNPDPVARDNWIAARQTATDLKITYNQATLAENDAYSKLINVRNVSTTQGQQLIARETRGG